MDKGGGSQMQKMRFIYYSFLVSESWTRFILWAYASGSYFCGYFIKSHAGFIVLL